MSNSKGLKKTTAESAGGVVYRVIDGRIEVVLVGRTEPLIWALPKGTPVRGESREQTAAREVREETGLTTRLIEPIGSVNYWFVVYRRRVNKTVYYYLMEPTGGHLSEHDPEYDRVAWFSVEEALRVMSYSNEAGIVRRAQELIEKRAAVR